MARGLERFADDLAAHGLSGLIVPDLPLEESDGVRAACDAAGLALVPLVAPTTPDERMARIGASARGFVYAVSVAGTTGERAALADAFADIVDARQGLDRCPRRARVRHRDARAGARGRRRGADGVIVGSRLVRAVAEARGRAGRRPRAGGAVRPGPQIEFRPHMGLVVATTVGLVDLDRHVGAGHQGARCVHDHRPAGAPGRHRCASSPPTCRAIATADGEGFDEGPLRDISALR